MAGKSEIISLSPGDLFGFFFSLFFPFVPQTNKQKKTDTILGRICNAT